MWVFRWVVIWITLSCLCIGVHLLAHARPSGSALESLIKPLANVSIFIGFPAGVPGVGHVLRKSFTGICIAYGVGSGAWCLAVVCANAFRCALIRRSMTHQTPHAPSSPNQGRRHFLINASSAVGGLAVTAPPAYTAIIEPLSLTTQRYRVPIAGLPETLDSLHLVHLSDTHLSPTVPESHIVRAIDHALALRPDLFVLTGDYITRTTRYIERIAALCAPLCRSDSRTIATVGVLGNHDWYGGGPAMRSALENVGVTMIDNDRVFIDARTRQLTRAQPRGDALCIAGLGDLSTQGIDTRAALAGVARNTPRIVLAHQPDTAEHPELTSPGSPRVDLMLSGHTHGGQVRFPFIGAPIIPSRFGQKYAGGLVRSPRFPVIVSRGIGMSGLPVRFGVPPEIVEITLTRAPEAP